MRRLIKKIRSKPMEIVPLLIYLAGTLCFLLATSVSIAIKLNGSE